MSASDNCLPPGRSIQSISASLAATSGRMVEDCETKASSWELKQPDLRTSSSQQVGIVDSSQVNFFASTCLMISGPEEEKKVKRKRDERLWFISLNLLAWSQPRSSFCCHR